MEADARHIFPRDVRRPGILLIIVGPHVHGEASVVVVDSIPLMHGLHVTVPRWQAVRVLGPGRVLARISLAAHLDGRAPKHHDATRPRDDAGEASGLHR